jgi:hypothetical protein
MGRLRVVNRFFGSESKVDIEVRLIDVHFTPESGHCRMDDNLPAI